MSTNSTRPRRRRKRTDKPAKPYPEFPLRPHATGYWVTKIQGRNHYFGQWGKRENRKLLTLPDGGNWRAALAKYNAEVDDLHAGRIPRTQDDADSLRLNELLNRFLNSQELRMKSGELSPRSFSEYGEACELIIQQFGVNRLVNDLRPDDFEKLRASVAKRWGLSRRGKFIQLTRSVFKYGADNGLITRPVLFGTTFKKPSKTAMRKHRAAKGKNLFSAAEVRLIINALDGREVVVVQKSGKSTRVKLPPNPPLKAITLLAINGGLGNTDVSDLQFRHLENDKKWIVYPRPKTGMKRRIPLWPETTMALGAHLAKRRQPKNDADSDCIFINRAGRRMVQVHKDYQLSDNKNRLDKIKVWSQDYVSSQFRSVLRKLNINGRKGLGFYTLRHTFATIGLQTGDRDAVKAIEGHVTDDVLSEYDETGPSDERLRRVTDFVRRWLFGAPSSKSGGKRRP